MDWHRFVSRSSLELFAALAATALAAAGCAITPGDPAEAEADSDAMYTPYESDAIQPVDNAPFAMPAFARPRFHRRRFDVMDFGAVGDGVTKNTAAFARAVAAAKRAHGGQIIVPPGKWLTGPIQITSDDGRSCDGIDLHVEAGAEILFSTDFADYFPVVRTRWEGMDVMNYSPLVYFRGCKDVALTGEGTLTGQGWVWWLWKNNLPVGATKDFTKPFATAVYKKYVRSDAGDVPVESRVVAALDASTLPLELQPSAVPVPSSMPPGMTGLLRPMFVEFNTCRNVLIEGVTVQFGPFWQLHPVYSENVIVRHVNVISFPDGGTLTFTDANGTHTVTPQNGDGCDPDSSRNVLIEDSFFNTSDDVVAVKSGLNEDGQRVGMPSENIVIRRIRSGNGHGGVTVGSEMSGSVRNVFAFDSDLTGDTALRIKTLPGRGGEIRNIHYDHIRVTARNLALEVTTNYPSPTVTAPNFTLETRQNIPVLRDLFYSHISGTVIGTAALGKVGKAAAIYIEGVPPNVLQLPYNAVAGAPATAAAPVRNVHMHDFVITGDNTWNWFDSAYMTRFPDNYNTNTSTSVSAAELTRLDTAVPGYRPSQPYGPDSTYSFKSCLDVCPIEMRGVSVTATSTASPSLAVDRGTFSCVLTDVTACH